jgi:hypothetical protein
LAGAALNAHFSPMGAETSTLAYIIDITFYLCYDPIDSTTADFAPLPL